ncbi:MAG: glycoside hydrolase [Flavobacterium sp.]|nr:glycoside hydrolase [Pedobacter sp.]
MSRSKVNYLKFALLLTTVFFSVELVNAQSVKHLYIANDDHTDYMWTGNEAQYDTAFVKMLDYYLDEIDASKNNPDDFQTRFNCDGNYWLKTYQKYRSPSQFIRLINAIRSGHISVPLNSVVSTFGAQPAEAVIRGMYYAGNLERKYDLRFTLASSIENNTMPLGLSSLWAGSGAKYTWRGVGGYGSQLSYESRAHRNYYLYNYTGLDSSSLLMKWYPLGDFGNYAECRLNTKQKDTSSTDLEKIIKKLAAFCDTTSENSKYPYSIAGAFGYGHDNLDTYVAPLFIKAAMAQTNESQKVRVANEEDFFRDVAAKYPQLPSESLSYGNEWDLLCASMNETTAEVKRATEKLRSAEALETVVSLNNPNFAEKLEDAKKQAYDAFGLYWEHNWTADGPVGIAPRAKWQIKLKNQIVAYTDSLYELSKTELENQIASENKERFFVFNPLSWQRNDFADVELHETGIFKIIDTQSHQEVPYQSIEKNGKTFLRIAATNIPPVGYKVYDIVKGKAEKFKNEIKVDGSTIQNEYYSLTLSPSGVITHIFDKSSGKDLVFSNQGSFFNDVGVKDLNDGDAVTLENYGPVSATLKAVSRKPVAHTVRVTLFANQARIDIENSIDENFNDNKTWSFDFNVPFSTIHHEEVGAILTVKKASEGGDYADENARYDWQTFNHFVEVSNNGFGVTLSNLDCSFFKLGNSTKDFLDENSSQIKALAGGRIDRKVEDNGVLGVPDQFGNSKFNYHFALYSYQNAFDATKSMKFALAHQNPLATGIIKKNAEKGKMPCQFSLLKVEDDNVLLWSLKPAEKGRAEGIIARFWNVSNQPSSSKFQFYQPIREAWQTSHIETNQFQIPVYSGQLQTSFRKQQIRTLRIKLHP